MTDAFVHTTPESQEGSMAEQPMPQNVVDTVLFGRRLRSLRILRGYDRVPDFVAVLRSQYGIQASARTVYAIERGEQMPTLDFYIAATCALAAERDYFSPAYRADCVEYLAHRPPRS